jgi:SpoIID/LytB domain protein
MLKNRERRQILAIRSSIAAILLSLTAIPAAMAKDVLLRVGIVQRFGDDRAEQLTLAGTKGDRLSLRVVNEDGKETTLQTDRLKLEVIERPLPAPIVEERVILSDHATFETAENSANKWEKMGIKVEITQPDRWQVWAKRAVYENPLLRRWLIESLKTKGYTQPYIDTNLLKEKPRVSFVVNGTRYFPKELEIRSNKDLIQVAENPTKQRLYGGSLRLQPNAYGTFTLVNNVPLETYLRGVVPHEIGQDAPESAARAQTIIARTYALRNLRRFRADDYELCADTHCQVYYGLTGTNPRADRAIAETRGLVLTYQNELVDALYSSTTGGITALFSDVWDGQERPYLRAVVDSPNRVWDLSRRSLADETTFREFINLRDGFNETGRKVFRWKREASIADLNKDLEKYLERKKHPLANFKTIQWMEVTKRSPSGRILTLTIQTDRGILELYKNEVRSALGPPRSTLFYLDPVYDPNRKIKGYVFTGGGFGHGVGLSQFGSYNLSRLGWSPEQILAFYYPGTKIQPLNDSIVLWRDKE